MNLTTNAKGQIAATKAELRALELGLIPSKPILDTRYDLILDDGNILSKVQIKYADGKPSQTDGSVVVKLAYANRTGKVYVYEDIEIDALVVYIPKIDRLCKFPQELFIGKRNLAIRISKPKNNQVRGVIFAKDYYW